MAEAASPPAVPPVVTPPAAPAVPTPTPEKIEADRKEFMNAFVDNPRFMRGGIGDRKPRSRASDAPPVEEPIEIPAPAPKKDEPETPPKQDDPPADTAPADPPEAEPVTDDPEAVVIPNDDADRKDDDAAALAAAEQARIDARVNERLRQVGIDPATNAPPAPPAAKPRMLDDHESSLFAELEKINPGRYAGIAQKVSDFRELEGQYRKNWITNNPGKAWNPDDEDHGDFYKNNEPKFSTSDFKSAERAVERKAIVAEVREEVRKEVEPELQQLRAERKMQSVAPKIAQAARSAEAKVMSAVPDFKKIMDNGKGGLVLSRDTETKMQENNPVLHHVAAEIAEETMVIAAELAKMDQLGAAYPMDLSKREQLPSGKSVRPHVLIVDALDRLEEKYATAPAKDQIRNGKQFITIGERQELMMAIQRSNLSPQAKAAKAREVESSHWSIDAKEIEKSVVEEARGRLVTISQKIKPSSAKVTPPKKGATAAPGALPKTPASSGSSGGSDTAVSSDVVDGAPPAVRAPKNNGKGIADFLTR